MNSADRKGRPREPLRCPREGNAEHGTSCRMFDSRHPRRGPAVLCMVLAAVILASCTADGNTADGGPSPTADHPEGPGGDPFSIGFRDLSTRARASAPARVVRRWVEGHMEWFFAVACLTAYRTSGTMPSLSDYVNLGPRDRAMNLTGSLIELAEGTCLPDAEREPPAVRAVTQVANMLVTIGNDLFSLHRETEHDVLESNFVSVLQHERDCTTEQAVRDVVALHDRLMCRYLTLREEIEPTDRGGAPPPEPNGASRPGQPGMERTGVPLPRRQSGRAGDVTVVEDSFRRPVERTVDPRRRLVVDRALSAGA
ncbi:terpene synthase family protein [Streptomyces sp. NPDC054794]